MKKHEHLLSVTELKNILKPQAQESLVDLILDCCKINPQVKEYITAKYVGQDAMEQIFKDYKYKVHNVFFQEV